jgi:hypothetical protein
MVELVSGTFEGHVGERFELVPGDGEPFTVTLSRCDPTITGDPGDWIERIGRVFELRHPALGSFSLFLVPVGPDDQGMRYEAVIG